MGGWLCFSVNLSAILFIVAAFAFAVAETIITLMAKVEAIAQAKEPRESKSISPDTLLEALAKVLAALKDLPAWVAIFLAGLALAWTATSAPGLCA